MAIRTKKAKKPSKGYKILVRSRHPSHKPLRKSLSRLPFRTVVRLGSTWIGDGKPRVQCNSVDAVRTSASKLLMKRAFDAAKIVSALWEPNHTMVPDFVQVHGWPIVAKHTHGSRGRGNTLLRTPGEFDVWAQGKTLDNYIFEKFYDYSREYRLHVTKTGCFYTCRKMLKENTPENKRWFRNDSNCVWILENNPQFDKPINWDRIVNESVKALNAVGLDVGAIDVRVQSAKDKKGNPRKDPQFIILETNSAPSFGTITLEKYLEIIPSILQQKVQKKQKVEAVYVNN